MTGIHKLTRPARYDWGVMSTITLTKSVNTNDEIITSMGAVRIDDLFIGVEKNESSGITCYYITVSPQSKGSSAARITSAGSAIGSDDDAVKFLERLQELKDVLKLASF